MDAPFAVLLTGLRIMLSPPGSMGCRCTTPGLWNRSALQSLLIYWIKVLVLGYTRCPVSRPPTSPGCVRHDDELEHAGSICAVPSEHGVSDFGTNLGFPELSIYGSGCGRCGSPGSPPVVCSSYVFSVSPGDLLVWGYFVN